jgi:hypothetical protein
LAQKSEILTWFFRDPFDLPRSAACLLVVATLPALPRDLLHLRSQVRPRHLARRRRRRLQLHPRRALLRVRAHAGQQARAPRLLVLPRVADAGAQVAQLLLERLARWVVAGRRRRRPLHRPQPGVQDPRGSGVLPAVSLYPRGRDVLSRRDADALPLDVHGRRRRARQLQRPLDHRGGRCDVGRLTRRGDPVGAADLDEAGDLLRGSRPRHVHEHQEAPALVVVELANVDGGGAAVGGHVAGVAAGLDLLDPHAAVQARDGDARLLHGDREEPADAARKRVLDRRVVLHEVEGAARGLRDGVHRRRVVAGAEPERVDRRGAAAAAGAGRERRRHEVRVAPVALAADVSRFDVRPDGPVLAVGEEDHAGDGVPVAAAGEHLRGHAEALADSCARPVGGEGTHGPLRRGLPRRRHAREARHARRAGREGDHGEAVVGAELVDDEAHGLLEQRQLAAAHAAADVEHGDEVDRRARHVHRGPGVHEHREGVPGRAAAERRELALRREDHAAAFVGRRRGPRRLGGPGLQRFVVLVHADRRRRGEKGNLRVRRHRCVADM